MFNMKFSKLPAPSGPFKVGTRVEHWYESVTTANHHQFCSTSATSNIQEQLVQQEAAATKNGTSNVANTTSSAPAQVAQESNTANLAEKTGANCNDRLFKLKCQLVQQLATHMKLGIKVKIWFPIAKGDHRLDNVSKAPYMHPEMIPYVKKYIMDVLPNWLVESYMSIETHSYDTTAIASGTFPILLFSHGMSATPEFYTHLCENLASNGFIIIAPYHTDGSCLHIHYRIDNINYYVEFERPVAVQFENREMAVEEFLIRNRQHLQRVQNMKFLLKKITQLHEGHPSMQNSVLMRHTEKKQSTGIIGHSFGGATSVAMCCLSTEIKCGMALDGWLFGLDKNAPSLKTAFFFISSEHWQFNSNLEIMHRLLKKSAKPQHMFSYLCKGARHYDFCDIPSIMPVLGRIGRILGRTPNFTMKQSNQLAVAYFIAYLRDQEAYQEIEPFLYKYEQGLPTIRPEFITEAIEQQAEDFMEVFDKYASHIVEFIQEAAVEVGGHSAASARHQQQQEQRHQQHYQHQQQYHSAHARFRFEDPIAMPSFNSWY